MNGKEFLEELAKQLGTELGQNLGIKTFVSNSDVIGAYAEASVRKFVSHIVSPLRVSTGAVIDERLCREAKKAPQLDTMIWSPSPAPAIFCVGDFGLVPRSSCFGIMEIKRSAYDGAAEKMQRVLERETELVGDICREPVCSPEYLSDQTPEKKVFFPGAIGVICVKLKNQSTSNLDALRDEGRAVVLLEEQDDGEWKTNAKDIHRLVNFLIVTRARAKVMDGQDLVNIHLL